MGHEPVIHQSCISWISQISRFRSCKLGVIYPSNDNHDRNNVVYDYPDFKFNSDYSNRNCTSCSVGSGQYPFREIPLFRFVYLQVLKFIFTLRLCLISSLLSDRTQYSGKDYTGSTVYMSLYIYTETSIWWLQCQWQVFWGCNCRKLEASLSFQ